MCKKTVLGYVLSSDELKVLLITKGRGMGKGKLNGPGGKVDVGEALDQALVRELQEEIGITPIKFEPIGTLEFFFHKNSKNWNNICKVYLISDFTGQPIAGSDASAVDWYDVSNLPYDRMWEDDKIWLPKLLSKQKFHYKFNFNKEDLLIETICVL